MVHMYCDKCGKIIETPKERIIGSYYTLAFNGVEICKNCADELRGVIDRYLEDEEE